MNPADISISDFSYTLPDDCIAKFPLENRDDSKLLIYRSQQIEESQFKSISDFLPPETVLVFNTTKVVQARLYFRSESGHIIEVFCLNPIGGHTDKTETTSTGAKTRWQCLVGNLKRWKEHELRLRANEITLSVINIQKIDDTFELEFNWQPNVFNFYEVLEKLGQIPIPPYLNRQSEAIDKQRYQTVYAQNNGSVAAPTAGLHFTPSLLDRLEHKGVKKIHLTLHVGAGTFKPVKSATMQHHIMHEEWLFIDVATIENIKDNLQGQIICVGTTSLRAMESLYWMGLKILLRHDISVEELEMKQWEAYELKSQEQPAVGCLIALLDWMRQKRMTRLRCRTQLLVAPPYQLKLAKGIITNFHQPQSTLLLLVAAVVGNNWKTIYNYALEHNFRFLSYGDSSLLLP